MAITVTNTLVSDLTLDLDPEDVKIIKILGNLSTILFSLELIDVGATAVIKSSINSTEFAQLADTTDLAWENIKIDGVSYSEVTFAISSVLLNSPNYLYIENTSLTTEKIRISLRGNR